MPSTKGRKHSSQAGSRIIINVGGLRHETHLSTLQNIPDTRLSWLGENHSSGGRRNNFDSTKGEYFFDRHPSVFAQILNYYRTGKLHCPNDVCGPLFEEELGFWGIDEEQVETCCWENFKQHKEKQEKLKYFNLPGIDDSCDDVANLRYPILFDDEEDSWWKRNQPKIWKSLEKPHSSTVAKIIAIISFIAFAAYIIKFSLTTLEHFKDPSTLRYQVLTIIHLVALMWFSIDFCLRVIFSPDKVAFLKSPYTWTDLSCVASMYMFYFYPELEKVPFLEMLPMLKVLRIFQLFKFSYVLQVLVNTLKASSRELCLLVVFMAFVMLLFATVVYFLERHESAENFRSVPHSMWWAVITMTTVGYGEVYPSTWGGKMVGCLCAICGVLVIALPVSVVASNFSIFYTYVKARLNVPPKTKRVALSHALTSMHSHRSNSDLRNHSSLGGSCSEDRRNTWKSVAASDASYTSLAPSPQLTHKTSSPAMCNRLKPLRHCTSKSLSSLTSETAEERRIDAQGIKVTLETPTRSASVVDLSRPSDYGPSCGGLLQVPFGRLAKIKDEDQQNSFGSFGSFGHLAQAGYPLYLRRGAVSPASFSLKSTSTNSSFSHLPRGSRELCNALQNSTGPIIVLADQSIQSLNTLHPNIPFSFGACTRSQSETNLSSARDAKEGSDVGSFSNTAGDGNSDGKSDDQETNDGGPNHLSADMDKDTLTGGSPDTVSDFSPRDNMFLSVPADFGPRKKSRSHDDGTANKKTTYDFFASDSNTASGSSESDTCDDQRRDNHGNFGQKRYDWSEDAEDQKPQAGTPLLKTNGVEDHLEDPVSQYSPENDRVHLLSDETSPTKVDNNVEVKRPIPIYPNGSSNHITTPLICIELDDLENPEFVTHDKCYDGDSGGRGTMAHTGEPERLKETNTNYDPYLYLETDLDFPKSESTQV